MKRIILAVGVILSIVFGASGVHAAGDLYKPLKIDPTHMPIGSIILWATDNDLATQDSEREEVWMICDGRALSQQEYSHLYDLVKLSFGEGNGPDSLTFSLPDLRGMFVRGANTAGKNRTKREPWNDPNAADRTAMHPGGNTGDNVGSVQKDENKKHNHSIDFRQKGEGSGNSNTFTSSGSNHEFTRYSGGDESRPINAYLNYLIRVK